MGDRERADEASSEALRLARERKDGTNIGAALRVRGEVCFECGNVSDALVHPTQAIQHLEGGAARELARVYRTLTESSAVRTMKWHETRNWQQASSKEARGLHGGEQ